MECQVCTQSSRHVSAWICLPCVTHAITMKRTGMARQFEDRRSAEFELEQLTQQTIDRQRRQEQLEQRRTKIERIKHMIAHEKKEIDQVQSRLADLKESHISHAKNFRSVRDSLSKYQSDFAIQPEEMKRLQTQLATVTTTATSSASASSAMAAATPSAGTPAQPIESSGFEPFQPTVAPVPPISPSSAARRRYQANPLFTQQLIKFHRQLTMKLSKYRLHVVDQLLRLYVIRRKSTYSCSVVGLEVYDDPEVMCQNGRLIVDPHKNTILPPSSISSASNPSNLSDGGDAAYLGPPGSDPQVNAAALGYVVFVLNLLASYLDVRLPYTSVFHGSHSYVISHQDGDEKRLYLTLLDNMNPSDFRAAITFVDHNIQYMCEKMTIIMSQTSHGANMDSFSHQSSIVNFAPLHILPNMLKLIQSISIHLRQQQDSKFVMEERRDAQAREILKQKDMKQQLPTSTMTSPPFQSRSHSLNQSMIADETSLLQSIVTVHRQDALPPSAYHSMSGHFLPHVRPSLSRLDSPPFFSDHVDTKVANLTAVSPMDSPVSGGNGRDTYGFLSRGISDSSSNSSRPSSSAQSHLRSSSSSSSSSSSLFASPQLHRSDLLTPSAFFGLSPNGYFSTEEPRDSVLLTSPPLHERVRRQQTENSGVHQSQHSIPNHSNHIYNPGLNGSSSSISLPSASLSSYVPPVSLASLPTALASLTPNLHSMSTAALALLQENTGLNFHSSNYSQRSLSHPSVSHNPAVSYASEADVEWDLVDVITDETEQHQVKQQLRHIQQHSHNRQQIERRP